NPVLPSTLVWRRHRTDDHYEATPMTPQSIFGSLRLALSCKIFFFAMRLRSWRKTCLQYSVHVDPPLPSLSSLLARPTFKIGLALDWARGGF
ncbi:hypothetical protein T310_9243, partial [Rasamsonia emersonii CBS 393.64]